MLEKIAVIGAGPAGCAFCSEINTDKYKVYLLDKKPHPKGRDKEGILAERAIDFIQNFSVPEFIFAHPKDIHIGYIDLQTGARNLQDTIFLNINRFKFDNWLIDEVKENVQFFPQTEFLGYSEDQDKITVKIRSQSQERELDVSYVIGADGPLSNVRKSFAPPVKTYKAIQKRVRAKQMPKYAYFFYHSEITDYCSWIIPKEDHLIIGSALDSRLDDSQTAERFALLELRIVNTLNLQISECFESCQYILSKPQSREDFVFGQNNKILLIGEAAGLVSASSGEGIGPAFYSGQQAARALNENGGLKLYQEYCSDLVEELSRKIRKSQEINTNLSSVFVQRILEEKG